MKFYEQWRTEHEPYINDRGLQERLREQFPDREVWVGDSGQEPNYGSVTSEKFRDNLVELASGIFVGRAILPSTVILYAASDLGIYGLGRNLKDPEDAAEFLLGRTDKPHVAQFLEGMFELAEGAHDAGLHTRTLEDAAYAESVRLLYSSMGFDDHLTNAELCDITWETRLLSVDKTLSPN